MGSFSILSLDGISIAEYKNEMQDKPEPFVESDRLFEYPNSEADLDQRTYKYRISAREALKRLESLGYTEEVFEIFFAVWKKACYERNKYWNDERLEELKKLTPKIWNQKVKFYFLQGGKISIKSMLDILMFELYTLPGHDEEWLVPGGWLNPLILAQFLRVATFIQNIEFDITETVKNGWIDLSEPFLPDAIKPDPDFAMHKEYITVLAEGTSDINCIREAMRIQFPEHFLKFRFIDMERYSLPGGSGNIVNYIKLMYAVGTPTNLIIAVLDNDFAGAEAVQSLKKAKIPETFTAVILPWNNLASNYPVKLGNQIVHLDLNGRACAIEMYLGKKCLSDKQKLIPVKMKSLHQDGGAGPGELLQKGKASKNFIKMVRGSKDPDVVKKEAPEMFAALEAIIQTVKLQENKFLSTCVEKFIL